MPPEQASAFYREAAPFRPAAKDAYYVRVIPVAGELPGYRAPSARRDLLAGLTVAALAIPSAMTYAEVAGLSPVHGLYALVLPALVYVFLGSSKQLPSADRALPRGGPPERAQPGGTRVLGRLAPRPGPWPTRGAAG